MSKQIEMLDALFEYATEGIIVCDKQGMIKMVNPTVTKMFGYAQEELIEKKIEILLPKRYHHSHVKVRETFAEKPSPRSMGRGRDLYGMRKDGTEIMVEISLSPFSTNEGEFIMSFVVDITQRKKNEFEIRLAHERLQQTSEALSLLNSELEAKVQGRTEELADAIQRLADSKREVMRALEKEKQLNELKSRFITTASHEFRTPLGAILSSVSLIGRYEATDDVEKRKKHIDRIKSSVSNLTEILNDFLSLEKLEEGIIRTNPIDFDLKELANEITDELQVTAKKGQAIRNEFKGVPNVHLDRQLLRNSMINLISNAIKYSPEEKQIEILIENNNGSLLIEITDHGIGIPEEDHANIFERFYRASNAGNIQGTGLGLNIVKKYVELMDGEVSFTSEFGKGTTFRIVLPIMGKK